MPIGSARKRRKCGIETMVIGYFRRILLTVGLLLPTMAGAQTCIGVPVLGEADVLALARVTAEAKRVNFVEGRSDKRKNCPSNAVACRRKATLAAGDEVLAAPGRDGFVCATFILPGPKATETSGFLPEAALQAATTPPPQPADWVGRWSRQREGVINIALAGDNRLILAGEASLGDKRSGTSGEFEAIAVARGGLIAVGEGYSGASAPSATGTGCQIRLRLFGRYLAVDDNGLCGGIGVSFTGLYVKRS